MQSSAPKRSVYAVPEHQENLIKQLRVIKRLLQFIAGLMGALS